ncbi:hypothetical protein E1263_36590 [Kribbella antibiotica]|uniref:Uncharacterized protein n=1 Tax=Kribbella antibiotica TaxID=190195 RepID=A0A4R4YMV5_9ACTN|nr:hypothetical protein [Kribbella antibiotica]TDD46405.1 hypothetical protein E1263_36590 [Kribbella antibiotica]
MDNTTGVRQVQAAVIQWAHANGGAAQALARLIPPPETGPAVVVISELAANADATGLVSDFAGAAGAALAAFGRMPQSVHWFAHHGDFSSYDGAGAPETFTDVTVHVVDGTLRSDLTDQRLLPAAEAEVVRGHLRLEPVAVVLQAIAQAR